MKMIFIDCEFTSIETSQLLSIGLVTEDGRKLYVELAGESHLMRVSTFALDTVVPQFGLMPQAVVTQKELGQLVGAWLLDFKQSLIDVGYNYHAD